MSDCTRLSDRMPDVVRGLTRWNEAEERHLRECSSCGVEWALVERTAALGDSVRLDPDRLAVEVAGALARRPPASPRRRLLPWLVPLAAAAAIAVTVGVSQLRSPAPTAAAELSLLPELETLSATELESILGLLPDQGAIPEVRGFEELSEDELTAVLDELEG